MKKLYTISLEEDVQQEAKKIIYSEAKRFSPAINLWLKKVIADNSSIKSVQINSKEEEEELTA